MANLMRLIKLYKDLSQQLLTHSFRLRLFAVATAALATLICGAFALSYIQSDSGVPYDVDGWGFLIQIMSKDTTCWSHLPEAYNPYRGWLLPLVYGASYCVVGIPESVQLLNLALFFLLAYGFVFHFGQLFQRPLEVGLVLLVWALWPAHTYIYGYYFSEIPAAFLLLAALILAFRFFDGRAKSIGIAIAVRVLLGLYLHIRSSGILWVASVSAVMLWAILFRPSLRKAGMMAFAALCLTYSTLPVAHYMNLNAFVPLTTQGGFALYEGTFLPGDDLPANAIRAISEEFRNTEAEASALSPAEQDKFFKQKALDNVLADPVGQLGLLGKKLLRFWMNVPGHSWVPTTKSLIVGLPVFLFWLLSLFVLRKDARANFLTITVVATWLMHALIHSEYRYSYVVLPIILFQCTLCFHVLIQIWVKKFS